ncbi:NAD(P)H-dependent flavin oxidoreductase [Halorutilales archaeon Cl-col2-1]
MSPFDTKLTKTLNIDLPIVQAPIGSATCPELVTAVSEAGALGMLSVTWRDESETREVIERTKRETQSMFGVNIVVDPDAKEIPTETHVDICLDEGIEIFSFSFGEAAPYVEKIQSQGGKVLETVGSAQEAREAVDAGVDIVVAQGWEAGGHVESDVATLPLIPRVRDAVPDTPVVAAGGISDGRGVASVLTLGADGAWLGTRFVATHEAYAHQIYQDSISQADETETVYTTLFDRGWEGVPHRVIENQTVSEAKHTEDKPSESEVIAVTDDERRIRRYEDALGVPGMEGNLEELPLYAGQSSGLIDEVKPAKEVITDLVDGATKALEETCTDQVEG